MPIKPENRSRYPADWPLRSRFIRHYRAKNRCEFCGVPNYALGYRDSDGTFIPASGNVAMDALGQGIEWTTGKRATYKEARRVCSELNDLPFYKNKWIVIVLTVAHIHDHSPEKCSFLNLAALCQQCHNRHDVEHRKLNKKRNQVINA